MVVNFDVPHDAEDYVHRIGRTARADADGEALTFVSDRDRKRWAGIERFLGKKIERMQIGDQPTAETSSDRQTDRKHDRKSRGNSRRKSGTGKSVKSQEAEAKDEVKPAADTEGADSPQPQKKSGRSGGKRRWNRRRKGDAAKPAAGSDNAPSSAGNQ